MRRSHANRVASALALVALAGACSGCALEDFVVSDEFSLLWAVVPLLGIGGLATPIFVWRRRAQIGRWDIAASPTAPSAMRLIWWVSSSAASLFFAFLGYNLYVPDIDPKQITINAVAWAVGSGLGVFATARLGRRLSEPKR
jgi:hypothetical protein